MNCDKCGSDRVMSISGKTSDMCCCRYKDLESDGYVPKGIVVGEGGYGDYIQFSFCLECGKIQGKFPVSEAKVKQALKDGLD
jgi:hypothetical protein